MTFTNRLGSAVFFEDVELEVLNEVLEDADWGKYPFSLELLILEVDSDDLTNLFLFVTSELKSAMGELSKLASMDYASISSVSERVKILSDAAYKISQEI